MIGLHPVTRTAGALLLASLLTACGGDRQAGVLNDIHRTGQLKVVTRVAPTTYYVDRKRPQGLEYELVKAFADELGAELVLTTRQDLDQLLGTVEHGEVHLAAAGLTVTPERQQRLVFGPAYQDITQLVLYRGGSRRPRAPEDLVGKRIRVLAGSSHEQQLAALKKQYPDLAWEAAPALDTLDLFQQVQERAIDFTIIDSNSFHLHKGFYPDVRVGFALTSPQPLAWALPPNADDAYRQALNRFFRRLRENGTLEQIKERYYGYTADASQAGARTFYRAVRRRLPRYENLIREVADEFDIAWPLLAAISYQESHWNPRARSPTGVRGMMMLTLDTAREVGVSNRLSPEQSLRGGAAYYRKMKQRLPEAVEEPDRTWIALAAYNVGYGHLRDAMNITEFRGGNPHRWSDVKRYLPLLENRDWYRYTRHGRARGSEPVTYVDNIRHYTNLLTWHEQQQQRQARADTDAG